jgi:hypothetical protein
MWKPSSENPSVKELRKEILEEIMHCQFQLQLFLSCIIANTIAVIIETKHQFQSNSITFDEGLSNPDRLLPLMG